MPPFGAMSGGAFIAADVGIVLQLRVGRVHGSRGLVAVDCGRLYVRSFAAFRLRRQRQNSIICIRYTC
ncbi:hypothetical protein PAMC26577_13825 [Caballeronia sordidicola]|uniref:Uncharacterized protein n=1 Tax=Caballeronia sordidicola TaxID=196367 RepID=A0A242MV77_CABSO|nr:hypothetical protein PAMC26577_13825 [Caballeronia sordidicola]